MIILKYQTISIYKTVKTKIKNIFCISAGYVKGPTIASIANKPPELNFCEVHMNEKIIN